VKRRALLGSAALAALPLSAFADLPAVLQRQALATPLGPGLAMLAVARAGRRLVAAGERGIVLTSDDAGRRWAQAHVPVQASLTALRFADEQRGWAAGHLGVLLGTTDGGRTWALQLDGVRAAQQMLAASTHEAQRKSAQQLVADGPDKPFFDLDVQAEHLVTVGAYGLAFESLDGGASWVPFGQRLPNPKRLHLYGVRLAGERILIVGEQGLVMRSNDRGASFEVLSSPYKGSFFGVLAAKSGTLLAYGLRGNACRSTDAGSSWTALTTGVPVSISAAIERPDGTLLLVAQNGDLLTSRDDGQHFERRPATPPFPATALAATADNALVVAGLRGIQRLDQA
jgi:photosystem II stability/assembly factor-like uncharacterized protein